MDFCSVRSNGYDSRRSPLLGRRVHCFFGHSLILGIFVAFQLVLVRSFGIENRVCSKSVQQIEVQKRDRRQISGQHSVEDADDADLNTRVRVHSRFWIGHVQLR